MYNNIFYIEANCFNPKSHDLINMYFKKNFNSIKISNLKYIIDFIKENNNSNNTLLIYNQGDKVIKNITINLMKFLKETNEKIHIKIYIFIFDFWYLTTNIENKNIVSELRNIKNFYVLSFANIEKLNYFNNFNINTKNNNIILFNSWSSYNSSFIKFNNNPINKILVTGRTHKTHYPERNYILKLKLNDVVCYNYNNSDTNKNNNNYNIELNKYVACFYSGVYVNRVNGSKQKEHTKILLLKFFEILSSGSLLVCDTKEIDLIESINMINKKHFYAIDLSTNKKQIQSEIDFILNPENKKYIDNIRKNGQIFSKEYLNSEHKFNELLSIIN